MCSGLGVSRLQRKGKAKIEEEFSKERGEEESSGEERGLEELGTLKELGRGRRDW
jgi:hypothetical protein